MLAQDRKRKKERGMANIQIETVAGTQVTEETKRPQVFFSDIAANAARWMVGAVLVLVGVLSPAWAADAPSPPEAAKAGMDSTSMETIAQEAFISRCAVCHVIRTLMPTPEQMKKIPPKEIYAALRHGVMQEAAIGLDDGTLHALANFLGGPEPQEKRLANGGAVLCRGTGPASKTTAAWPGWSLDATNTRSLARELSTTDAQNIRLKWVFVFPDTQIWKGAANPLAVADGRVYVGSINKWVYALDAQTGCAYWAFEADGRVRSNAAVADGVVVFADLLTNVYGLDARTGKLLWRQLAETQATARITGSVTVHKGRVYVPVSSIQEGIAVNPALSCCTTNGSVVAYDLKTGKRLWQTYMIDQPLRYLGKNPKGANRYGPSGVSIFVAPTIDAKRGLLYVGTANQHTEPLVPESDAVVALDLVTGAKRWVTTLAPEQFGGKDIYHIGCEEWANATREGCPPVNPKGQGDRDFAAPVMLVKRTDGKDVLVAGSKDGMLYALDPEANGKVLWNLRVGKGGELGGIEYGMATDGTLVYAPVVDWSIGVEPDGALNAVDLMTGKLTWRTPTPKEGCTGKEERCTNGLASPALVVGDLVFSGGLDGVLRAYDRREGTIVWSYDAVQSYKGVNGLEGNGGAFGMGGAVVVGDMLYVTSGLEIYNISLPGNVLLAFELSKSNSKRNGSE
jgi:polyvinyl alcohol dehydrogenase (cytochrome)